MAESRGVLASIVLVVSLFVLFFGLILALRLYLNADSTPAVWWPVPAGMVVLGLVGVVLFRLRRSSGRRVVRCEMPQE